jgi:hypothetical protein
MSIDQSEHNQGTLPNHHDSEVGCQNLPNQPNVFASDDSCGRPACPVCGGGLIEIRAKFQCSRCHRICETCCEGGRG